LKWLVSLRSWTHKWSLKCWVWSWNNRNVPITRLGCFLPALLFGRFLVFFRSCVKL
jgi:hypothetical protein